MFTWRGFQLSLKYVNALIFVVSPSIWCLLFAPCPGYSTRPIYVQNLVIWPLIFIRPNFCNSLFQPFSVPPLSWRSTRLSLLITSSVAIYSGIVDAFCALPSSFCSGWIPEPVFRFDRNCFGVNYTIPHPPPTHPEFYLGKYSSPPHLSVTCHIATAGDFRSCPNSSCSPIGVPTHTLPTPSCLVFYFLPPI